MTVAEIKDFIKQEISFREEEMEHHEINVDIKDHINCLDQVKDMLDELEQEKNMYNELENKIVRGESIPFMANEKFIEMLEKDTEPKENNK